MVEKLGKGQVCERTLLDVSDVLAATEHYNKINKRALSLLLRDQRANLFVGKSDKIIIPLTEGGEKYIYNHKNFSEKNTHAIEIVGSIQERNKNISVYFLPYWLPTIIVLFVNLLFSAKIGFGFIKPLTISLLLASTLFIGGLSVNYLLTNIYSYFKNTLSRVLISITAFILICEALMLLRIIFELKF